MKILLTSDDSDSADILAYGLRRGGFAVALAGNNYLVVERCQKEDPDIVLVEQSYAGPHTLRTCQDIRGVSSVPIIVYAFASEDDEIVRALELGVDEYLQKPVSPRQLAARIRAVVRRSQKECRAPADKTDMALGDMSIRFDAHEVLKGDRQIPLTSVEFRILHRLAIDPGQAVSVENLAWHTWGGDDTDSPTRKLRTHISRLRKKLQVGPYDRGYIRSVPGRGYKLQA